jgi:hypothetical protein
VHIPEFEATEESVGGETNSKNAFAYWSGKSETASLYFTRDLSCRRKNNERRMKVRRTYPQRVIDRSEYIIRE